ncbi:MAG: EamA family transporter [Clostridia bacterium]|nr:EamA family transporter [Clostridia bacterium]
MIYEVIKVNYIPYLVMLACVSTSIGEGLVVKKHGSKYSGGFVFTGIVSLFSMAFFLIKDLLTDGVFTFKPEILMFSILGGFLYGMASVLTYEAFSKGSYALSNLILSYALVFKILYGLIIQGETEDSSVFTYIGFAVLAISIYLIKGRGQGEKKPVTVYWLICIILSFVGSGMYGVVQRIQQKVFSAQYDNEFMVMALGFSAVALIAIGLIKEKNGLKPLYAKGNLYAVGAGAFNGLTNMTSLLINTMFLISRSSVLITGTKLLLVFLISVIFYKEKFTKTQIVGAVMGAAAVILFNL